MKIVIPMTGYGSRFVAAGYKELKPLIKVHHKPIIEWVVRLFPHETDFLFICRKEHLTNTNLKEELVRIAPMGQIVSLDTWEKRGPVNDVYRISDLIEDDKPVIVNYCDFYMTWNWQDFKETVLDNQCEGAIPCYTGFHPHLIPDYNLYASCKVNEEKFLLEIREKYSFETDKKKGFHSVGTYYFKRGDILKESFKWLMDTEQSLNGEYYVSMAYNYLVQKNLKTYIYDKVDHFCQWGTPEDLKEYLFWVNRICKGVT